MTVRPAECRMGRGRLSISQRERGRMGGVAGRRRLSLSQGEVGRTGGILRTD